jgi:hypothetical protein
LGIGAGIGDDNQAWLLEGSGDVVGEVTWGETTGDGAGTSVGSELEDSTLTVRTGGDDTDIGWVVDGSNDTGCENNLLPILSVSAIFPKGCIQYRSQSGGVQREFRTFGGRIYFGD